MSLYRVHCILEGCTLYVVRLYLPKSSCSASSSSELGWYSLLGDSSRLRWCAVDETLLELLPSLRVRRLPLIASGILIRWASATAATMSGMSAVVKGCTSEELLVFVLFGFGLLLLFARFLFLPLAAFLFPAGGIFCKVVFLLDKVVSVFQVFFFCTGVFCDDVLLDCDLVGMMFFVVTR